VHDLEFDHDHDDSLSDTDRLAIATAIWEQETVDLLTVGIDIGSSTTHLLFARVVLRRQKNDLSGRFEPVERRIVWRSPILLTPFLPDGSIDAAALRHFFGRCYRDAGIRRSEVDSGAVILTGEAIKRSNARAIDEIFAEESGRFVCATAGHQLESMLAAQGSGAVGLSQKRGGCALHVDIGGGTTKLAIIEEGVIRDVAAFAVGGRLLAQDADGRWTRIDEAAQMVARALGFEATPETLEDFSRRTSIIEKLAHLVLDQVTGTPLDELGQSLLLTSPLTRPCVPGYVTFSGGVAEYIFQYEERTFGDIAKPLAAAIVEAIPTRLDATVVDAGQRLRATVIGASQFTVQVSGNTLFLGLPLEQLPIRNVPVVRLRTPIREIPSPTMMAREYAEEAGLQGTDLTKAVALTFEWAGVPEYGVLLALAQGLVAAASAKARDEILVVVVNADIALSLGRIIRYDLGYDLPLICVDAIEVNRLDFIDIGQKIEPTGVVPIVIKSLLFAS
jgi:ethanolamine utilization protein EutA